MNKVNFKCWTATVRSEGTGTRLHAIRSIFCATATNEERKEILEELNRVDEKYFSSKTPAPMNEVNKPEGGDK